MKKKPLWRRLLSNTYVKLILGVLLLVPFAYYAGWEALANLSRPRPGYITAAFLLTLLVYFLDSFRWWKITREMAGIEAGNLRGYFAIYTASLSIGQIISQFGGMMVIRPMLLKRKFGVNYRISYVALFAEKSADFYFLLIFMLNSVVYFAVTRDLLITLLLLPATLLPGLLIYIRWGYLFERWAVSLLQFIRSRLAKDPVADLQIDAQLMKRYHFYPIVGILSFGRNFILALRLVFLALGLNIFVPYLVFIFGIPAGQLSLLFSFTPGALGILEGGWFAILNIAGIDHATIGKFLVGQRAYWIIFSLLCFAVAAMFDNSWKSLFAKPVKLENK